MEQENDRGEASAYDRYRHLWAIGLLMNMRIVVAGGDHWRQTGACCVGWFGTGTVMAPKLGGGLCAKKPVLVWEVKECFVSSGGSHVWALVAGDSRLRVGCLWLHFAHGLFAPVQWEATGSPLGAPFIYSKVSHCLPSQVPCKSPYQSHIRKAASIPRTAYTAHITTYSAYIAAYTLHIAAYSSI